MSAEQQKLHAHAQPPPAGDAERIKQLEAKLRDAEERHALLAEGVRDFAVIGMDAGGVITSWGEGARRLVGYEEGEILGRPCSVLFTPEDRANGLPQRELRTAAESGSAADENWIVRKDGTRFWGSGFSSARRGEGGLTGYVKVLRDLTERRRASDARREGELRLRAALAAADMGTWLWQVPTDKHTPDENLRRLLGVPERGSVASLDDFLSHVHEADREATRAAFLHSARDGSPLLVEFRVPRPDGSLRWLRDKGEVFRDRQGRVEYITGACVDVTERKAMEDGLRESEARLRVIVEGARDYAIITTDPEGVITGWSPGAEAVYGWSAQEAVGRPMEITFTPEDLAAGVPEKERAAARESGSAPDVRWHVRKDGSPVFIDGVSRVLGGAGGAPAGFLKVGQDVTVRRRMEDELRLYREELEQRVRERTAELERSRERALQAERLAAIGQTVTALAHEGRNALQRAHANLARLALRQEGRPDELDLTGRTQAALRDLERLFDDVRSYAAPVRLDRTACDMGGVWREAWAQLADRRAHRDARLEEAACPPGPCEADAFRLGQVFLNLFANALDACPDPVVVRVACSEATLGGRPALRVSVRDNGPGFPPEHRGRLFEPFLTSKPAGTGLGMAICRRVVEAHGGTIEAGEGGPGAEVVVTLPRGRPASG